MSRRGLKITGGRDDIYMPGNVRRPGDTDSAETAARIDGDDAVARRVVPRDARRSNDPEAGPQTSRGTSSTRLELRTRVEPAVDDRIRALAARIRITPDVVYRTVRGRTYARFRSILAEREDIKQGPAPDQGTTVRFLMHVEPIELAEIQARFDPLQTGKVAYALKGPFSRLFTAELEHLEAAVQRREPDESAG